MLPHQLQFKHLVNLGVIPQEHLARDLHGVPEDAHRLLHASKFNLVVHFLAT